MADQTTTTDVERVPFIDMRDDAEGDYLEGIPCFTKTEALRRLRAATALFRVGKGLAELEYRVRPVRTEAPPTHWHPEGDDLADSIRFPELNVNHPDHRAWGAIVHIAVYRGSGLDQELDDVMCVWLGTPSQGPLVKSKRRDGAAMVVPGFELTDYELGMARVTEQAAAMTDTKEDTLTTTTTLQDMFYGPFETGQEVENAIIDVFEKYGIVEGLPGKKARSDAYRVAQVRSVAPGSYHGFSAVCVGSSMTEAGAVALADRLAAEHGGVFYVDHSDRPWLMGPLHVAVRKADVAFPGEYLRDEVTGDHIHPECDETFSEPHDVSTCEVLSCTFWLTYEGCDWLARHGGVLGGTTLKPGDVIRHLWDDSPGYLVTEVREGQYRPIATAVEVTEHPHPHVIETHNSWGYIVVSRAPELEPEPTEDTMTDTMEDTMTEPVTDTSIALAVRDVSLTLRQHDLIDGRMRAETVCPGCGLQYVSPWSDTPVRVELEEQAALILLEHWVNRCARTRGWATAAGAMAWGGIVTQVGTFALGIRVILATFPQTRVAYRWVEAQRKQAGDDLVRASYQGSSFSVEELEADRQAEAVPDVDVDMHPFVRGLLARVQVDWVSGFNVAEYTGGFVVAGNVGTRSNPEWETHPSSTLSGACTIANGMCDEDPGRTRYASVLIQRATPQITSMVDDDPAQSPTPDEGVEPGSVDVTGPEGIMAVARGMVSQYRELQARYEGPDGDIDDHAYLDYDEERTTLALEALDYVEHLVDTLDATRAREAREQGVRLGTALAAAARLEHNDYLANEALRQAERGPVAPEAPPIIRDGEEWWALNPSLGSPHPADWKGTGMGPGSPRINQPTDNVLDEVTFKIPGATVRVLVDRQSHDPVTGDPTWYTGCWVSLGQDPARKGGWFTYAQLARTYQEAAQAGLELLLPLWAGAMAAITRDGKHAVGCLNVGEYAARTYSDPSYRDDADYIGWQFRDASVGHLGWAPRRPGMPNSDGKPWCNPLSGILSDPPAPAAPVPVLTLEHGDRVVLHSHRAELGIWDVTQEWDGYPLFTPVDPTAHRVTEGCDPAPYRGDVSR